MSLEQTRKRLKWTSITMVVLLFISFPLSALFSDGISLGIVIFSLIIEMIIGVISEKKRQSYVLKFKKIVVENVIHFINPNWQYYPDKKMPEETYKKSKLIRKKYSYYIGDDLIAGKIDQTPFTCSELCLTTQNKTVFQGLFLEIELNEKLSGRTYITPYDKAGKCEKVMLKIRKKSTSGKPSKYQKVEVKTVKVPHEEFARHFAVHAINMTDTNQLLTPHLMDALLGICQGYPHEIHFSFIGSQAYCAIGVDQKTLFEPKEFSSGVKYHEVKAIHDHFAMAAVVVRTLSENMPL